MKVVNFIIMDWFLQKKFWTDMDRGGIYKLYSLITLLYFLNMCTRMLKNLIIKDGWSR